MGYDFFTRNESIKVNIGSLIIMKGNKRDNQYKLIGDPIRDEGGAIMKGNINVGEKLNLKSCNNVGNVR